MASSYISFYHYTSKEGLKEIIDCGFIMESCPPHTHFGPGTYGTSLHPDVGREDIAKNNWEHYGRFYVEDGKVDRAIEVRIPEKKVRQVGPDYERDILLYPNKDLPIDKYRWRAWTVPKNDSLSEAKLLLQGKPKKHGSKSSAASGGRYT